MVAGVIGLGLVLSVGCGGGEGSNSGRNGASSSFWQNQFNEQQQQRFQNSYQNAQHTINGTQQRLNTSYADSFRSGKCAHLPSSRYTC